MENGVQNILGKFSLEDIEKLKVLLSIVPEVTQKEVITLRVFSNEYSNLIKQNRSAAYHKSVVNSLKHLTDYFGIQRPIQTLELKDIESFISSLQKKVPKGFRVYVRTLKAAFSKALDWKYVKENYFMKVKLPRKQQVNPAFITSTELKVIVKQIEVEIVKDIVTFAFYTGMRLNEIVSLTWRNVNLTSRIITVGDEQFTTKSRNQRYIPICEEAFEAIVRRKTKDVRGTPSRLSNGQVFIIPLNKAEKLNVYVFCKPIGETFTGDYVSKIFKKGCKAARIDKSIHFHSLRHSFASNLVQKGVSLYTIKELLGHSSISTTEVYAHLNMDSLKEAIRTFDSSTSLRVTTNVKEYGV